MSGRQPINDQFGNERLVTQARPIAQTYSRQQAPDMSGWQGLAQAFAQGELLTTQLAAQQKEEDIKRATAWANSKTVEELSQEIKSGKILASESPVFVATAQHIHGRNAYDALERDVMSKVNTGQLTFTTPGEIDQHLTDARNAALEGAGEYTVAGFDKGFASLRPKLMDASARFNDKKYVEEATVQAGDALRNHLLKVTGKDFTGTPAEAAASVMQEYQFMRLSKVLPDSASKETLKETIAAAAAGGQTGLVSALLGSELPGIGSVRGFIGEPQAAIMESKATSVFDQAQRQRIDDESAPWLAAASDGTLHVEKFKAWATSPENKKYTTAPFVQSLIDRNQSAQAHLALELQRSRLQEAALASEHEAQQAVDAALTNGNLYIVQGTRTPQVLTASGDTKAFNVKAYAEQSLTRRTADLPFEQQVSAWSMNGLENPDWKNQLQAGLLNLASIGVDSKGKPSGQLNEAGKKAIELFSRMDAVSPDAARQTAGDTAYKRFSDIAFLMHLGRTPEDAASIAANASQGATAGSPMGHLASKVSAEVAKMTDTPWMDWLENRWGDVQDFGSGALRVVRRYTPFTGEAGPAAPDHAMRNSTPNTYQVHSMVQRYATLLAQSGQVGDADTALKLAVEYIANPKVSAKVNGTLYLRSELPTAPNAAKSPEEWLDTFIDAVPKGRAKELGYGGHEVRLEYDERSRVYRAFAAGFPLTDNQGSIMVWQKGSIERWYAAQAQQDIQEATKKAQTVADERAHKAYRQRLWDEIGGLQQGDAYIMERYDGTVNKSVAEKRLFSREAYERIVKDGNDKKPLRELMGIYPSRKGWDKR